ncbi:hypothetical protein KP509_36G026200 [Ceratopteris richardii]|uniref:histone acetyltransferase n=1 Tax=Ceratopteris richardii TaxID=49495 RepID=A0A8T2QB42_CERRI|nr:hypothetical protein KP509_36G026200 [Ceratopteris richardii]
MVSKDETELAKPAKRQRKVSFSEDSGMDPNECISIRIVSSAHEVQSGEIKVQEFSPNFAERFFGEDGKIFGYKNVKIIIWLHALSLHVHVEISHAEELQHAKGGEHHATNLENVFKDIFGASLIEDRALFLELLVSYKDSMDFLHQHGKRVAAWNLSEQEKWIKAPNGSSDVSKEILLLEDLTTNELKEWHARFTPLALMFIEDATSIDLNDPKWEVYVCLEKASDGLDSPWRMVGFCRVYKFFKYPDSSRLRVSQILVLPPYQGMQNGFHILEAIYKTAVERGSFEVTMEEPSNDLQVLRECMDTVCLLSFDPARQELRSALSKLKMGTESGNTESFHAWMPSPALNEESLLAWSLRHEVFGNSKSADVGKNKLLLDVENEYDSSRTFVMFKVKSSSGKGTNGIVKIGGQDSEHLKEAIDLDPKGNAENAFQELLNERKEEIQEVADKVLQYLKLTGASLVEL